MEIWKLRDKGTRMKQFRAGMVVACLSLLVTQALAQISSVEGPVPTGPGSSIFIAADVPGARLSIPLTPYGYVEEEYFVKGTAAAYTHSPSGPNVLRAKFPYTTRIIVRRPADPKRFSGVVHFEPIHPTQGYVGHWMVLDRYLMSRGDVYVAAGVGDADKGWSGSPHNSNESAPVGSHSVTKWFDPQRYSALQWPEEEGIRYEVMADIGRKLRGDDKDNPLRGMSVKAMLVGGWSYTGSIQRVFINEGFHDRARLANGRPVFDGYLVGVSSQWNDPGYLPLYNDEPFVPVGDARRNLKKTDARVIEFLTESEVDLGTGPQAADSDERLGGHRLYELGGVIHVANLADPTLSEREEPAVTQLLQRGYPLKQVPVEPVFSCPIAQSDIPEGAFVRAAVDNLRRWVLEGKAPPRAETLALNGKKLARDEVGNPKGGIRAAEFVVPLARYGRYVGSDKPSCREDRPYPFVFLLRNELSPEELYRRYRSPRHYLHLYDSKIDRLVRQRWLLPEDGLRLKAKAIEDATRQF